MVTQSAPGSKPSGAMFEIANLEVRPAELQVIAGGQRVGFTVREFELFLVLAERLDSVVQRPEVYELMWGGEMPRRDRSVDVLVRKVRSKLEAAAPGWSSSTPTSGSATDSPPNGSRVSAGSGGGGRCWRQPA